MLEKKDEHLRCIKLVKTQNVGVAALASDPMQGLQLGNCKIISWQKILDPLFKVY
jgi:hypothetical protein